MAIEQTIVDNSDRRTSPVYIDPLTGIPSDSAYVSILDNTEVFGQSGVVEPIWYWLPELIALYDNLIDEGGIIDVVSSFNGRGGAVVPAEGDYTLALLGDVLDSLTPNDGDVLSFNAALGLGGLWEATALSASAPIQTVFGRTGDILALEGDYSLDLLGDVDLTGAVDGDVLIRAAGSWGPGKQVVSFDDLTDVNTVGVTPGQYLQWNSVAGEWQPVDLILGATSLSGLSDVTISAPAINHVLVNDGAGQFINEVLAASKVSVTPTGNIVSNNVQGALGDLDTAKVDAKRPDQALAMPITTGVISGGVMTALSTTQFSVSAGSGVIVDTYTDYSNPSFTPVNWLTQTVDLLNPTTEQITYVSIDNTGTIITSNIPPTPSNERTSIVLGRLFHDPLNISNPEVVQSHTTIGTLGHLLVDYFMFIGAIAKGLGLEPNPLSLQAKQLSGSVFIQSVNEQVDPTNPNVAVIPEIDPFQFYYAKGNGDIDPAAIANSFDPTQYDPNGLGVLTPVSTTGGNVRATIQYVYAFSTGTYFTLYGQTEYTNIAAAQASIELDRASLVVPPELNTSIGPLYAVIMRQGAVDLDNPDDALIINLLGGGGSSSGASTPSDVTSVFGRTGNVLAQEGDYNLELLGDVGLVTPSNGEVLTFNGSTWTNSPAPGGGGAAVSVGPTPPVSPTVNQLWFDNSANDGQLYIYYDDGTSQQWIPVSPQGTGGAADRVVEHKIFSGESQVDFVTGINDNSLYTLEGVLSPDAVADYPIIRLSANAADFAEANGSYDWVIDRARGTSSYNDVVNSNGLGTDRIPLTGTSPLAVTDHLVFKMEFRQMGAAGIKTQMSFPVEFDDGTNWWGNEGHARRSIAEVNNGIRVQMNSNNLMSGELTLWRDKRN